jgi:putative transposase
MARPLRIEWEGAGYHTTARGNQRSVPFLDDGDHRHRLGLLGRMNDRYQDKVKPKFSILIPVEENN